MDRVIKRGEGSDEIKCDLVKEFIDANFNMHFDFTYKFLFKRKLAIKLAVNKNLRVDKNEPL